MKKTCILSALAALLLTGPMAQAQTTAQSVLIDFGVNDGTNGNSTASPDTNGNYSKRLMVWGTSALCARKTSPGRSSTCRLPVSAATAGGGQVRGA